MIVAWLIGAMFASAPLRVWANCGGCATTPTAWDLRCWLLIAGGVWVTIRTYLAIGQWLAWWYRRGHWLPPNRPALDAFPTPQAVADAVWSHPEYGVLRPWASLNRYERFERIEIGVYMAFAAWVLWQLSECHQCPRWSGDDAEACYRYTYLAILPLGVLVCFSLVRAYFGPLPERPTRRD